MSTPSTKEYLLAIENLAELRAERDALRASNAELLNKLINKTLDYEGLQEINTELLAIARKMRTITAVGFDARDEDAEGEVWEQLNVIIARAQGGKS